MLDFAEAAAVFVIAAFAAHYVTIAIALYRCCRKVRVNALSALSMPVSILRPVCGVDPYDRLTLTSGLLLDHPNYEVIFCCASKADPAACLVLSLIHI